MYTDFTGQLHTSKSWSQSFLFPDGAQKETHAISPVLMTREEASQQNIWWFDDLVKMFESGKGLGVIEDLIVHGSFGDFTQTNFSDLEISVFVNESVFSSLEKKALLSRWIKHRLNKLILAVDPLQHHGAFFLWDTLMSNYDDRILPVCAYETCWSVTGNSLNFQVDKNKSRMIEESRRRLVLTLRKLANPEKHFFRYGLSDYSAKRYLSNVMLIPAFFYQAQGFTLNKKSAIEKFLKEEVGSFSSALIVSTQIRDSWPKTSNLLRSLRPLLVLESIPQGRADILLSSMFRKGSVRAKIKNDVMPFVSAGANELSGRFQ